MHSNAIALVSHDLLPYGAQRLMVALIQTLAREHKLPMELVSFGGGPMRAPIAPLLPIHITGTVWQSPVRDIEPLAALLQRRGFRRVILNTVIAGAAAAAFARRGFSVLSLIHEMPTLIRDEKLLGQLHSLHQHAHAVVYPHAFVQTALAAAFPDLPLPQRSYCIAQGLARRNPYRAQQAQIRQQLRSELGIAPDCPIVLGVGSGNLRKGLDRFLATCSRINATAPDACFIWIGPISGEILRDWRQRHAVQSSFPAMLHLPGFVEDTARYHAAADVFFLASREDPFPFVVLESLDAGVPVVAFRGSGGGAEIAEKIAGTVVDTGDDVMLDAALRSFFVNDQRRAQTARSAMIYADDACSFSRYAQRLLDVLAEIDASVADAHATIA